MKKGVIIDTGAIVAIISKSDQYHEQCINISKQYEPPFFTTWAVLTEALYLLRANHKHIKDLFQYFHLGLIQLEEIPQSALPQIALLLDKYQDIKAQVADISLIYLAEENGISTIFTTDKKDFSIYRLNAKTPFTIIPEI